MIDFEACAGGFFGDVSYTAERKRAKLSQLVFCLQPYNSPPADFIQGAKGRPFFFFPGKTGYLKEMKKEAAYPISIWIC